MVWNVKFMMIIFVESDILTNIKVFMPIKGVANMQTSMQEQLEIVIQAIIPNIFVN